jgi:small subunit ribosomal protein S30e
MPTHGSITKAGKVRNQTPKIESQHKRRIIPRIQNRGAYIKLKYKEKHDKEQGKGRREHI